MHWEDFDAFCLVVDHGGFTAAARATDRPKSSLSASVTRLEAQVGARLLERTTRQLRLTDDGEALYREISKPLSQLREFATEAITKSPQVQGTLRVAAPYEFGAHHLASVASAVMKSYPQMNIHLDVEHARVALFERNYDIVFSAIEHSLAPSTVVVKRVYTLERGIFAAPELVHQYPQLTTPRDLNSLPLLAGNEEAHWGFRAADGSTMEIDVRTPRLRSGNASARLASAKASLGVTRITATFCEHAVAQGELVRLLPEWHCEPLRIYALLPGRRLVPAKVRIFLEALEAESRSNAG
ncbi:LysR family transcriptional regulator [Hydrogenophaga sp.]|uniref:LysR family transcriptional regulator n=1 Tax=Hydrogenophaga sp. TaxID=1904254 RepID=UPI003F6EEE20